MSDEINWYSDATELFLLYMVQYATWANPTRGACSPALSEFFRTCHPEVPAEVHWVRWLHLAHESDEGIETIPLDAIQQLVEAHIARGDYDARRPALADQLRRAAQGEPLGQYDPRQLDLFT